MPTCAPIGSMSTRALVLSTFVALIEAKAIVTNNCPHDVFVWSVPAAGSLHTENLLVKSGAKYEEVWRYGTATNPGVAIKITSESNGIYKDTPEIDFAYSIDAHDASKIWIDLSPVRGSPVHHLSFHTCHGASETAERPTEQCHAADDITLTLCNPGQSTSAKHTMSIHESHPAIATTSAHQSTTHLSTYRSSTVECSIPQSMTSKEQSVPEPTRSKPHHSPLHFQPNRTSAFSQSRKPMTKTVSVVYAAPKTITQEHYSMPRSTTIKSQYAPPQSKASQTLVYSSYRPANRSSSFEYIRPRPKPTTAYHNEYSEPEPTTLEPHAPLSRPRPNITAHPSWSTRAAYPYVKVDSTVRKHITSPVYLLLD